MTDRASANSGGTPLQGQERVLADHTRLLCEASRAVQDLNDRLKTQEANQQTRDTQMENLGTLLQALTAQVSTLATTITPPTAQVAAQSPVPQVGQPPALSAVPSREPSLASPRPFDGTFSQFRGFLMQCKLVFSHQPSQFSSPAARVAFITNLTTGEALGWAEATLSARPELFNDYAAFLTEFGRVFDHPSAGQDVGVRLMSLRQGSRTVAAYATEFRTLAAGSGWNDAGLRSAFRQGLAEVIKDELVRDKPTSLNELVGLAIDVDERVRERRRERARHQIDPPRRRESATGPFLSGASAPPVPELCTPVPSGEEPMQLGRARLTVAEKQRRRTQGLCLYCGERGHLRDACPSLPKE